MQKFQNIILLTVMTAAFASWLGAAPTPMGTAFNYQGYLTDKNGNPITGQYDLQFQLFDVPSAGAALATDTRKPVAVNKGLFGTNIDFGPVFDGKAYWLQIGLRPDGSANAYDIQTPRQQIRPVPNALFAHTASNTAPNSVSSQSIQDNTITVNKIASGQLVKSLNGLVDNVILQGSGNISVATNGNTLTISSGGGAPSWSLTGNAGTTAGQNFLGTTDNHPLELKVNNIRALRLEPGGFTANFNFYGLNTIGGHSVNRVFNGAVGATIAGGGAGTSFCCDAPNEVGADFGAVGGGVFNSVGGSYGTVPGGYGNHANGWGSFAAGQLATAQHDGSFVWGDGTAATSSSGPNTFVVRAAGGVTAITSYLQVTGAGGEKAYLGGDGFGGDVQLGSLNPAVSAVALYNGGNGQYMDLYVRTLTITGGADLAEPFQMSHTNIPKGSVVVIDDEHPGQLKPSTDPYDTRVAGIVSGANDINPGLSLRQEGKLSGGENVALSGRVYVLADTENGAIKPGDLLTSSSITGHAMKVTDHTRAQGAVLGKAMSALSEGRGMVLVLVTLQ